MKYQNRFGMHEENEEVDDHYLAIKYLFLKQKTIEDIQSLTLYMYSIIGSISSEALLLKGLEIRNSEKK